MEQGTDSLDAQIRHHIKGDVIWALALKQNMLKLVQIGAWYKFAATTNGTKARDKFIKGPMKLQLVVETIELDNYNRKYSDKKIQEQKTKENIFGQFLRRRTNRLHKTNTEKKNE